MTSAQSIEFMMGMSFLIIGLSYLLRTEVWAAWIDQLAKMPQQSAIKIGGINLVAGVFVLGFHWIWHGMPMLTTIFGAFMTFKGTVHMLSPDWLAIKLKLFFGNPKLTIRLGGVSLLIFAFLIISGLIVQPGIEKYLCQPFQNLSATNI